MAMEKGENLYDDAAYSKAKQVFDGMVGYYPENAGAWMYLALCQYKSNLVQGGRPEREGVRQGALPRRARSNATGGPEEALEQRADTLLPTTSCARACATAPRPRSTSVRTIFMKDPDFKSAYEEVN